MPVVPLDIVEISAFLGGGESQGALVLQDFYSPSGSQNLYLSKSGRLATIGGYAKQNSSAVTTNTGGSTATFRSLFQYRAQSAGSFTRQLVGILDDETNEWEIWYSTDQGANWTFISDRGATPVGQLPDFAISGTNLYITVPKTEIPRVWNGTALAAAGSTVLAAPSVTSGGTGALTGNYAFKIVPVLSATGVEKAGSATSAYFQAQAQQLTLGWVADADGAVGGYNIYRTTGVGKIFYFDSYVSGRTTIAYTSSASDLTIIQNQSLSYHGDAPPSGVYFCEPHKQRMWWGRTDTYPRRWYYADPGQPDSVYTDNSFIDFTDGDSLGDITTGGTGDFKAMFVAWLEFSVWTISGTGQVLGTIIDWNRRRTDARVGTVHHRTVAKVPEGARYTDTDGQVRVISEGVLAYLSPYKDIRLFDGQHDTIISESVHDTLSALNYQYRAKSWVLHDPLRKMFIWFFPSGSGTECASAVAWDYQNGAMFPWTGFGPFSHGLALESSTVAQTIVVSQGAIATGGYLYQLWSGTTFDGSAFTWSWMSKPLYPRGASANSPASLILSPTGFDLLHRKRFRYLIPAFTKQSSPATVTVGVYKPTALATDSAEFSRTISGSELRKMRLFNSSSNDGRYYHDYGLRVKLSATTAAELDGLGLVFQVLPGTRRSAP